MRGLQFDDHRGYLFRCAVAGQFVRQFGARVLASRQELDRFLAQFN